MVQISKEIALYLIATVFAMLLLFIFSDLPLYSVIGVCLFLFFSIKAFMELGHRIEIRDIMILIALLQWIIGPILSYLYVTDDTFYYMVISQEEYMNFALPASAFFIIGLYLPFWKRQVDERDILERIKKLMQEYPYLDLFLIGVGSVSAILEDFVPAAVKFVFYLTGNIRFIGLYFLMINNRPYKWFIFGAIVFWFFAVSVDEGMFHDLILWMGFLFIIIAFLYRLQFWTKTGIVAGLLVGVFLIQAVKHEYRKLAATTTESKTALFTGLVRHRLSNTDYLVQQNNLDASISRINQGWIIARIMYHTPRIEPFAEGETIRRALISSLLPRILAPNKARAGGRENFSRFTGHELSTSTSMNLSILGEAYANYGIWGGAFFMMLLGVFYNYAQYKIFQLSENYPTLLFWIPLIFLQVVKAEGDFAISLNHILKAAVVVWGFFYFVPKVFNIRL